MDSIILALGNVLITVNQVFRSFPVTILIFALMIRILFVAIFTGYFRNIKLGPFIQPEMDKLSKKFKANPEKYTQELPALMISKGYSLFGNIVHFISNGIFAVLLGLVLFSNETALTVDGSPISVMLFQLPLNVSPGDLILTGGAPKNLLLYALVLYLGATGLHTLVDKYMQDHTILDTKRYDAVVMILVLIGCFGLPLGVSLFWFAVKVLDLIHILLIQKFYKVNPEKLNKMRIPVKKK